MCLAVPMQIVEINGLEARCEARGVARNVSLLLLMHEMVDVGDHVMVHVGQAVRKVTEAEARSAWELFDEMLEEESRRSGAYPVSGKR